MSCHIKSLLDPYYTPLTLRDPYIHYLHHLQLSSEKPSPASTVFPSAQGVQVAENAPTL